MMESPRAVSRRQMLQATAAGLAAAALRGGRAWGDDQTDLPPIRQITQGPTFHWFGYYDKLEFDPTCRFVLGQEVDFEHRSPTPDDVIKIGMVDLHDGDRWIELGESRAWCWQQGCMLQWRPGSKSEVIWNDREGDRFVCQVLDVFTRQRRTIEHPIYALSPCGNWAVSLDFRRVQEMRPGYGYPGVPDPNRDVLAPQDSGIFRIDLESGKSKLVVSLHDIIQVPMPGVELANAKSYFNHLLVNPDATRFEFLHRWGFPKWTGATRMFTADKDGRDLRVIDPSGHTSHFIWRDPQHILAWTRPAGQADGFYLFEDRTGGSVQQIGAGVMKVNGHCTYLPLPGHKWILNDTYPQGKERLQNPYLYNVDDHRKVALGHFYLPPAYRGEWRCDTHPRFSPDGRSVVIDSPHTGQGRQLFLIDISGIVGS